MITIDLEKSLIKENKKIATPDELLYVKEYDKLGELEQNDALSRIGINSALRQGKNIKDRLAKSEDDTKRFNKNRVFHISQIEAICNKYYLRFLPSSKYMGAVDISLPNKISTFETAYSVRCDTVNTRIIAPARSFYLEEKPKDPLLFYQINDEYFYLIHKWGNDLSILRSLLPLFTSGMFCWAIVLVILASIALILPIAGVFAISTIAATLWSVFCFLWLIIEGEPFLFLSENYYDSTYRM